MNKEEKRLLKIMKALSALEEELALWRDVQLTDESKVFVNELDMLRKRLSQERSLFIAQMQQKTTFENLRNQQAALLQDIADKNKQVSQMENQPTGKKDFLEGMKTLQTRLRLLNEIEEAQTQLCLIGVLLTHSSTTFPVLESVDTERKEDAHERLA
jgi:hypothetical protein